MSINMSEERILLSAPPTVKEVENSGKPYVVYAVDGKNTILHQTQVPAVEREDTEKFEKHLVDSNAPLIVSRHGHVGMCSVQVNKDVVNLEGMVKVVKQNPAGIIRAIALDSDKLYEQYYCPESDVGFIHIKGELKNTRTTFNVIVAREQDVFSGRHILNPEDYTF